MREVEDLCLYGSPLASQKLEELNAHLTRPTDFPSICSYYGACETETFLRFHLLPDPYQHKNLTDDALIWLIHQCQLYFVVDDVLTTYYGEIVDINLGLTLGTTMTDLELNESANIVLQKLRDNKPRVIHL